MDQRCQTGHRPPPNRPRLGAGQAAMGRRAHLRLAALLPTATPALGTTPRDPRSLHAPRLRHHLPALPPRVLKQVLNAAAFSFRWDPYPFILLNLAFSTQAAYAAPLILLAQTRQADRDKMREDMFQHHREEEAARTAHYEPSRRRCSLKTATSPNSRQRCQDSTPSCSARTRRLPNESHASPTSSTRPCSGIAGRRPNPGARSVQPVCVGNGFCRDLAGIL